MGLLRMLLVLGVIAAGAVVAGALRPDLPVAGALARALRPEAPEAGATPPARVPDTVAETPAAPTAGDPPATDEPDGPALYRFIDESGTLRIVASLEDVPPSKRAGARRFASTPDRPAFDTTVSAAPAPPPRRAPLVDEPVRPRYDEVVLYVTSWCGYCKRAAADLEARGIDFEMRNIEDDDDARAELREKTGRTSVPVLDVDGRLVPGYSARTYARLFAPRNARD